MTTSVRKKSRITPLYLTPCQISGNFGGVSFSAESYPQAGTMDQGNVFRLPMRELAKAAKSDATPIQIGISRMRELWGALLTHFGIPGAVRDIQILDALTGQEITVHVGDLFTRLSVNGRDYYFHRVSGKFDGAGSAP